MKRIVVVIVIALFLGGPSLAEDRLDQVPSMSGKIEIMEQLGLIDHEVPVRITHAKKTHKSQKLVPEKIRMNRLADIMSSGD